MLKIWFISLFALFISTSIWSQNQFGVIFGANYSSFKMLENEIYNKASYKLGYDFGVFFRQSVNSKISSEVSTELSFVGSKLHEKNNNNFDLDLTYIYICSSIGYHPIESVRLFSGPRVGFLLNSNLKFDPKLSGYHKIDAGIDFGISGRPIQYLEFSLVYYLGLSNINKSLFRNDSSGEVIQVPLKNRNLHLKLTIWFKKQSKSSSL